MAAKTKKTVAKKVLKKAVKKTATKTVHKKAIKTKVASAVKIPAKEVVAAPRGLVASVTDVHGKRAGSITLPAELFAAKVNKKLLAQSVRVYLSRQRTGNASTKTRGEVEGSTRKIYRQKGTGRARHGAIRAPIFRGGGIVFGPRPRDFSLSIPKKMQRLALASALTAQYTDGNVHIIDGLEHLEPKTKFMAAAIDANTQKRPILLIVSPHSPTVVRAARNIADVEIIQANNLSPYMSLSHASLLFTKAAIALLKETFVGKTV